MFLNVNLESCQCVPMLFDIEHMTADSCATRQPSSRRHTIRAWAVAKAWELAPDWGGSFLNGPSWSGHSWGHVLVHLEVHSGCNMGQGPSSCEQAERKLKALPSPYFERGR